MKKIIIISSIFGILSGISGAYIFQKAITQNSIISFAPEQSQENNIHHASYQTAPVAGFVDASKKATPAVVYIKTITQSKQQNTTFDFWNFDFFGQRGPSSASGSGVIISDDGYIVTNNHVVDEADDIEVILNNQKRSFKAKIIGTDPSTDLALLKIEGKGLPKISFGNSDNLSVGEWVLAVGNPFNLTSTVTAGIVSAKGRNINIVNNSFPIESFIQTDAAINPGNSGGALVDLSGYLIGINTAIASNTGSYNGYGFAIPANMVAKIVKDLIEHGEVQRGYTGMTLKDISAEQAEKLELLGNAGVYVNQVMDEGPADQAGINAGDVITKLDGKTMESLANFDEQISLHRPGDLLKITYIRKGKSIETTIKLINKEGNTAILKKYSYLSKSLGAELTPISKNEKDQFGIEHGIKVTSIKNGKMRNMGFQEGSIITRFNNVAYDKPADLEKAINEAKGSISIEGINPQGGRFNYNFFGY